VIATELAYTPEEFLAFTVNQRNQLAEQTNKVADRLNRSNSWV
jgi:hypothetical protein